jgi:MFS family permease
VEAAWFNFFGQFVATLYVLYAARDLGLAPVLIGITSASAGIGSIAGSVLVGRASTRFGFGRVLVATMVIGCAPFILIPLAAGPKAVVVLLLVLVYVVEGVGITASIVQVVSIRQVVTPTRLLGRMHGSYRVLTYGVLPLGALTAGVLGGALGTHAALLIGSAGILVAPLWVIVSPVWRLNRPEDAA